MSEYCHLAMVAAAVVIFTHLGAVVQVGNESILLRLLLLLVPVAAV